MRVESRSFRVPKGGNSADEYEDACWPERPFEREARAFRCAVADGATETSFAATWARQLVRAYCRGELSTRRVGKTLKRLRAEWRREALSRPLPWYAEEKVRDGAYSSIAGLALEAGASEVRWEAMAIGDSCIFQVGVEQDVLIHAFPLGRADAFNSRPHLLSSSTLGQSTVAEVMVHASGIAARGDTFFLMTDALAAWFLAAHERGDRPWRLLRCSKAFGGKAFDEWITGLRMEKAIRNDDVTVMTVHIA